MPVLHRNPDHEVEAPEVTSSALADVDLRNGITTRSRAAVLHPGVVACGLPGCEDGCKASPGQGYEVRPARSSN